MSESIEDQQNHVAVTKNSKLKEYFRDSFGTIFQKPQGRPPNMWKLLVNLNNKQRITFAAGKCPMVRSTRAILS